MINSRVVASTSHVIHSLRIDLVRGQLRPGEPLRLATLAERYGSSVSGVREALLRLSEQQLVTLTPNAGFRVKEVSRADLDDLTDLRVLVEGEALRLSVIHGDAEWEGGVVAAFHQLDRTAARERDEPGTTDAWADAHARFHHSLIAACGRPRLIALADSLRDSAELYRQLSAKMTLDVGRDIREEHRLMRDAAIDRNAKRSAALLALHLRRTAELLGPLVDAAPRN